MHARLVAAVAIAVTAVVAAGCLPDDPDPNNIVVDGNGSAIVVMSEFAYLPQTLTVDAGATIDLVVINEGSAEHEIMIGRSVADAGGYGDDLLARMMDGAEHSVVDTAFSQSDTTSADPDDAQCAEPAAPDHDDGDNADHSHDPPELPEHCLADDPDGTTTGDTTQSDTTDTDHDDGDHDHDADARTDDDQPAAEHGHGEDDGHHGDDHAGAHITVAAGDQQTVQLQVPVDADGEWEIGCFLPGHYEAGMIATLVIRPVDA